MHAVLSVDQRGLEDLQLQLFPNFTFQFKTCTCINQQLQTFASYSVTACSFVAIYSNQHCNVTIHTVSTPTTQVLQQPLNTILTKTSISNTPLEGTPLI